MPEEAQPFLPENQPHENTDNNEFTKVQDNPRDYWTFLVIGLSYLWPWNCFLAATAFFNHRFENHQLLIDNFSSCMMSASTLTSTVGNWWLADRQNVDYSRRVFIGEALIGGVFMVMALSCSFNTPAIAYFIFVMLASFISAMGTAFAQNGSFAIVSSFSAINTQAIMVGQAVSGILPPIISIITAFFSGPSSDSPGAIAAYFLVATGICSVAVVLWNTTKKPDQTVQHYHTKKHFPLRYLYKKLSAPSTAVFLAFSITLVYPVFVNKVKSVNEIREELFIPIVYLVWNMGDLLGRVACGFNNVVIYRSGMLVGYGIIRGLFVVAFFLCNIDGYGLIKSDLFYLLLQFGFGFTNGHLSSSAFMAAPNFVAAEEREAAGGFMTLALSLGLAAGSLISFLFVAML